MTILDFLNRQSKTGILAAGFSLVPVLWFLDYITGPDISFVVFYLFPVFLVAWFGGRSAGLFVSLASGIAWFTADMMTTASYPHPVAPYWNVVAKLGFFLIVNYTVSSLRVSLERERDMARTDYLTQVANSRYFAELATREINRAGRYHHPFTVAYLDIDNFKMVNDEWGHSTGDALLTLAALTIRNNIRSTDVIARLGGDEFVLLLPETGYEPADTVIKKVHQGLLAAMGQKGWPVTFSIGVVTFVNPPDTVDGMIKVADSFMYSVKHAGKNMIRHKQVEYQTA